MRTFQILLITLIVLTTSACASNIVKHQAEPAAIEIQTASSPVAVAKSDATLEPVSAPVLLYFQETVDATSSAPDADTATAEDPSQAEQNAEAIYGQLSIRDPWEGFNRRIHSFNNTADKFVLRPLAVGYEKITPAPVQTCVSRFFENLRTPMTAVNQVLQGRPGHAAQSLGRFVVNTTVGIGGLFDPASSFGMQKRDGEDFGQTLATWGWRDSPYLVLPLFGPRTVRDTVSIYGDWSLSLIGQIQDSGVADKLQLMEVVDGRTRLLPMDKFRQDAFDDYLFVRDAWSQRRSRQIQQDLRSNQD
ncbi:putative phospholipid-binding lipoprotein MlaA precursor [compost metagenome]